MIGIADTLSLLTPTDSQCEAFITHLADVHSWYKHLSLLGGGEFIVFLDPQAGCGYPLEHPLLPTSRTHEGYPKHNTVEAYRTAFGHLNYMWRSSPFDPFWSDGSTCPALEVSLAEMGRFTLYPYVACDFYWSVHQDAVTVIRRGAYHPRAEVILEAYAANSEAEQAWERLSQEQQEAVCASDVDPGVSAPSAPEPMVHYQRLAHVYSQLMSELRNPEIAIIQNKVYGLQKWHRSSQSQQG